MPFRQNTPPPAEPPPPSTGEADRWLASELRKRRLRIGAMVGVLALAVTGPFMYIGYKSFQEGRARKARLDADKLTEQEEHELKGSIDDARASLSARDEKWADVMAVGALRGLEPGDYRCPTAPMAPTRTAGDAYSQYGSIDLNYFGNAGYKVREREDGPGSDPEAASVRAHLDRLAKDLKAARKDDLAFVRAVRAGTHFTGKRSVVVIAEDHHAATVVGTGVNLTYAGGTLSGRAYQYDHGKQAIVCVGDIDVRNSSTVDIHYMGRGYGDDFAQRSALEHALERDLELEVRRALSAELRAVSR